MTGAPDECLGVENLLFVRGVDFEVLFGERLATATNDLPVPVCVGVCLEGRGRSATGAAALSASALLSIFASASMIGFGSSAGGTADGPDETLRSSIIDAVLG